MQPDARRQPVATGARRASWHRDGGRRLFVIGSLRHVAAAGARRGRREAQPGLMWRCSVRPPPASRRSRRSSRAARWTPWHRESSRFTTRFCAKPERGGRRAQFDPSVYRPRLPRARTLRNCLHRLRRGREVDAAADRSSGLRPSAVDRDAAAVQRAPTGSPRCAPTTARGAARRSDVAVWTSPRPSAAGPPRRAARRQARAGAEADPPQPSRAGGDRRHRRRGARPAARRQLQRALGAALGKRASALIRDGVIGEASRSRTPRHSHQLAARPERMDRRGSCSTT